MADALTPDQLAARLDRLARRARHDGSLKVALHRADIARAHVSTPGVRSLGAPTSPVACVDARPTPGVLSTRDDVRPSGGQVSPPPTPPVGTTRFTWRAGVVRLSTLLTRIAHDELLATALVGAWCLAVAWLSLVAL